MASVENSTRAPRRQIDKVEERRRELADAALTTLSELGYARTSLREIAQNSAFSHGVLHYYFRDKVDLITYCVRMYKAACVQRYDQIVADAHTADGLARGFAEGMSGTLVEDGSMHRLWYDLRSQSLFEESFRADVLDIDATLERMIWRILTRYAELRGAEISVPPAQAYAVFDGMFQQGLLKHIAGVPGAAENVLTGVPRMLELLVR